MRFEHFTDSLYIAKGENFVAILEKKMVVTESYYYSELEGWEFVVRERKCIHEKKLGTFFIKQNPLMMYDSDEKFESIVRREGIDSKMWFLTESIIYRAQEMLDALGYE